MDNINQNDTYDTAIVKDNNPDESSKENNLRYGLVPRKGFSFDSIRKAFHGRASRGEYWGISVWMAIALGVFFCVWLLINSWMRHLPPRCPDEISVPMFLLTWVWGVYLFSHWFPCSIRRLHDIGRSALLGYVNLLMLALFWVLAIVVCVITHEPWGLGIGCLLTDLVMLWPGVIRGTKGANRYGPEPVGISDDNSAK